MREKIARPFRSVHWSARAVVKTGAVLADILLLWACFAVSSDETLAYQMVQTAVYVFSEAVVGGLLMDVVAKRMGMEEK